MFRKIWVVRCPSAEAVHSMLMPQTIITNIISRPPCTDFDPEGWFKKSENITLSKLRTNEVFKFKNTRPFENVQEWW